MQPQETSDKLLYFHVTQNEYIDMYELCLRSASLDIKKHRISVLCITSKECAERIEQIHKVHCIPTLAHVMLIDYNGHYMQRYAGKLNVIDYEHLKDYYKVVYCDTDILFFPAAIEALFGIIKEEGIVYVTPEQMHFKQPWFWHKDVYTEEETQQVERSPKNIAINTGVFGWINQGEKSEFIRSQFKQIREHVYAKYETATTDASEQPYINHRWLLDQNIDYTYGQIVTLQPENFLQQWFQHASQQENLFVPPVTLHFTFNEKLPRMNHVMTHLLQNLHSQLVDHA